MKTRLIIAAVLIGVSLGLSGCDGCEKDMKNMHASFTGPHKRVTLYGANGTPIREWTTTTDTVAVGGTCFFLTADGKAVNVSGTLVIEEI